MKFQECAKCQKMFREGFHEIFDESEVGNKRMFRFMLFLIREREAHIGHLQRILFRLNIDLDDDENDYGYASSKIVEEYCEYDEALFGDSDTFRIKPIPQLELYGISSQKATGVPDELDNPSLPKQS